MSLRLVLLLLAIALSFGWRRPQLLSMSQHRAAFDQVFLSVRAGSGGQGSRSFLRHHLAGGRRCGDGGDGGRGADIYAVPDRHGSLSLSHLPRRIRADHGSDGQPHRATGASAEDVCVALPLGTHVYDNATQTFLGSLLTVEDRILIAKGGLGGRGNGNMAGSSSPLGGESRILRLELQLIAEVGLIGKPNVGKSSLLHTITNASPKIGNYAFTTLIPNLGVCYLSEEEFSRQQSMNGYGSASMLLADIPGLIEGAHRGVGLGKDFLRHVERCHVLVHVLDATSDDVVRDYVVTNRELLLHSAILASKPQIVVLNKIDGLSKRANALSEMTSRLLSVMPHVRLMTVSASTGEGLSAMKSKLWLFLQRVRAHEKS